MLLVAAGLLLPACDSQPPEKPDGPPFETRASPTTGMAFVRIPAGNFTMGAATGSTSESLPHPVTLTRDFWLGLFEVTQGEYFAVTGQRPSNSTGDRLPVESVSWNDAVAFANALSTRDSFTPCYDGSGNPVGDMHTCTGYRLPTEAEWEYATRAGTTTDYSFGSDAGQLELYTWYGSNSGGQTHVVGGKLPNPWGLYDVHGNVWEWVHDWYGAYPSSSVTDPTGPASAVSGRVIRGGGWDGSAGYLRSADRYGTDPSGHYDFIGFRLARAAR